jgi:hypothetical protein
LSLANPILESELATTYDHGRTMRIKRKLNRSLVTSNTLITGPIQLQSMPP